MQPLPVGPDAKQYWKGLHELLIPSGSGVTRSNHISLGQWVMKWKSLTLQRSQTAAAGGEASSSRLDLLDCLKAFCRWRLGLKSGLGC